MGRKRRPGPDARQGAHDPRGQSNGRGPHPYGSARPGAGGREATQDDSFVCGHCQRFVAPLPSGGRNRNHCPYCLYSRHVDAERPGDRASRCRGLMEPIGVFERPNGEEVIVHRCVKCGFERFNRVGADDDEAAVAALPRVEPRVSPRPPEAPPASGRL